MLICLEKGKAEALIVASKEIGLEINADKTKYKFMSRDQNACRSQNLKTDNSSFERVEEFKYLGKNLTNQNSIWEEIKRRLESGNACYHSVLNILFSSLPSKNLKIKIQRTTILSVVLYGCETWSLTLREERRLRASENKVLRRIFGPKRDEVTGELRKLHNEERNDLYSSPTQYFSGDKYEKNEMGGACSAYGGEAYTGFFLWGNLTEETTWENQE